MAATSKWPPTLKDFVNKTFASATAAQRPAVEVELKEVIRQAFESHSLWTTDWSGMQLKSMPSVGTKRKNPLLFTAVASLNVAEEERRMSRSKRFKTDTNAASDTISVSSGVDAININSDFTLTPPPDDYLKNIPDWDHHTIIGKSQRLEKPYLRLTSAPNPDDVRPLDVCKRALDHFKQKWRQENNYNWICDQLKSLRQDLTVQRIKNDFTVQVYEIHARIALEKGDLGEFNQCSSQLRHLYSLGLPGHKDEFLAYRILYLLYARQRIELNGLLSSITLEQRANNCVDHALQVRFAMSTAKYARFFKLYVIAPKMGGYLMDKFVGRERLNALYAMSRAYKQLPLSFIKTELAFDTDEECLAFLRLYHALHYKVDVKTNIMDKSLWDCSSASTTLMTAIQSHQKVDLKGQI